MLLARFSGRERRTVESTRASPSNPRPAIPSDLLERANGDAEASFQVGNIFRNAGFGEDAISWYTKAGQKMHPEASYYAGHLFAGKANKIGPSWNAEEYFYWDVAVGWLKQGEELGVDCWADLREASEEMTRAEAPMRKYLTGR